MWKRKKAHPRAEMLKDGPLLSLKLGYLSKFQSSFNQVLIKLQIKKAPDLLTCVPGAVRWTSVRSGDFVLPWRPNEENQERGRPDRAHRSLQRPEPFK
jgi:hypothetical protein